ncbi:MAG: hypothetical protein IPH03_03455 [Tetrasphaera sp.]|nr:hypothetical protein [Tetrasphaera sp.]
MKWWLFILAFLLGALLTWIYIVRRATREVRIVERDRMVETDEMDDEGYADDLPPAASTPAARPAAGAAVAGATAGVAAAAAAATVGKAAEADVSLPRSVDADLDAAPAVTLPRVAEPTIAAPVVAPVAAPVVGATTGSTTTDDDLLSLDAEPDDLDLLEVPSAGFDLDTGSVDLDASPANDEVVAPAAGVNLDAGGLDLDGAGSMDLDAPGMDLDAPGGVDLDAPGSPVRRPPTAPGWTWTPLASISTLAASIWTRAVSPSTRRLPRPRCRP